MILNSLKAINVIGYYLENTSLCLKPLGENTVLTLGDVDGICHELHLISGVSGSYGIVYPSGKRIVRRPSPGKILKNITFRNVSLGYRVIDYNKFYYNGDRGISPLSLSFLRRYFIIFEVIVG